MAPQYHTSNSLTIALLCCAWGYLYSIYSLPCGGKPFSFRFLSKFDSLELLLGSRCCVQEVSVQVAYYRFREEGREAVFCRQRRWTGSTLNWSLSWPSQGGVKVSWTLGDVEVGVSMLTIPLGKVGVFNHLRQMTSDSYLTNPLLAVNLTRCTGYLSILVYIETSYLILKYNSMCI